MLKLEYRKRCIGVTFFKWGVYYHLRLKNHWFHLKWSIWCQNGLRVSTRHQLKTGREQRYVDAYRFQVSIWHTHDSKQGRPIVFGMMFYGGRNRKRQ